MNKKHVIASRCPLIVLTERGLTNGYGHSSTYLLHISNQVIRNGKMYPELILWAGLQVEPPWDAGWPVVGGVQCSGPEQDLVHRVLGQLRGHQECGGVQQGITCHSDSRGPVIWMNYIRARFYYNQGRAYQNLTKLQGFWFLRLPLIELNVVDNIQELFII